MGAETMLDAISSVTQSQVKFPGLPLGASASQVAEGNSGVYFLNVFGRPSRATVCTCERKDNPTLAQSLHLINGDTIDTAVKKPGGRLDALIAANKPNEADHQRALHRGAFAKTGRRGVQPNQHLRDQRRRTSAPRSKTPSGAC
jgi:hypothetical protein